MVMSWSDLPEELLRHIASKITNLADLIRFKSVCSSWHATAASIWQIPWLLVPERVSDLNDIPLLFSLSENRFYNPLLSLPERCLMFFSSAHGWVLAAGLHPSLSLFNPVTRVVVPLPDHPFDILAIKSWDWSPHGILIAFELCMLFCRPGVDRSWTTIPIQKARSINYLDGKFYLFEELTYNTIVIDAASMNTVTVISAPAMERPFMGYLVVVPGALLLLANAHMSIYHEPQYSCFIKTFMADCTVTEPQWVAVESVGDRAFFADRLHCFSVDTSVVKGVQKNTIYWFVSKLFSVEGSTGESRWHHQLYAANFKEHTVEVVDSALDTYRSASMVGYTSWIIPSAS